MTYAISETKVLLALERVGSLRSAFGLPASLLVDRELEHIRPRIVSAGVELHAAGWNFLHVEYGVDHTLHVP